MRSMRVATLALLVGTAGCGLEVLCPGVFIAPMHFTVSDQDGAGAAVGTSVRVEGAQFDQTYLGWYSETDLIPGEFIGPLPGPGLYRVELTRPWHTSHVFPLVDLDRGSCSWERPIRESVRLDLLPGAPDVRQVVIAPLPLVFGDGGQSHTLWFGVVSAAGVPDSVWWSSSDTTVVTVDQQAVVTSRCRLAEGTAWVVGAHLRDPAVRDSVMATVHAAPGNSPNCPPPL